MSAASVGLLRDRRHGKRARARAWSVSQPVCASPVFASTLPSMPNADATCDGRRPDQLSELCMHSRRGRAAALPAVLMLSQLRTGESTGHADGRLPVSAAVQRAVSARDAHRHSTRPPQAGCLPRRFKDARHAATWAHRFSMLRNSKRLPVLAPLRACSSWSHECPASVAWLHSTLSLKSFSRPYARRNAIVVATSQSYWCLVGSWAPRRQAQGHCMLPGA